MKAAILVAGFGSRLRPLTDDCPKSLLPIGETNSLHRMVSLLSKHGINEIVFITGHFEDAIQRYVTENFRTINTHFVRNDKYEKTNTGYSLLLAREYLEGEEFIKFDGDVVFEPGILDALLNTSNDASYICMDTSGVDDEVIKAELGKDGALVGLGKHIPITNAAGESIGIEKISTETSKILFGTLETIMNEEANWQEYYEYAYDKLIRTHKAIFKPVNITGLKWVEMDNIDDYTKAQRYFSDLGVIRS